MLMSFLSTAEAATGSVDATKGIIDIVLQHGIVGAMLLIVLWGYFRKDKALEEERNARIEDAKQVAVDAERYGQTMVALQEKVIVAANKLIDLAGIWERREQQRELAEAATVKHDRDRDDEVRREREDNVRREREDRRATGPIQPLPRERTPR